ncbi:MAG: hypothetical protein JNM68_13875 [Dinghuibacter sp.]|nr:hypothetical protein [Dinghuibacter sp.]
MALYKFKYSIIALLATLPMLMGCQREINENKNETRKQVAIKKWLYKKYATDLMLNTDGRLLYGSKYPDWRFFKSYNYGSLNISEYPVLSRNRKVYTIKDDGVLPQLRVSVSKLLVAQNSKGDFRESVMTIIPRKTYLNNHYSVDDISLNNIPMDFNGIILFHDWKDNFLSGYVVEAGVVKQGLKPGGTSQGNGHITDLLGVFITSHCAGCDVNINPASDVFFSWSCPDDNLALNPCATNAFSTTMLECGGEINPFNCPCIDNQIDWVACGFSGNYGGGDSEAEVIANSVFVTGVGQGEGSANYLDCFTNEPGASYKITISADQPKPGYRDPYVNNGGGGSSGSGGGNINTGHSFITLEQTTPNGLKITRSFGFYPANDVKPLNPNSIGKIKNNQSYAYDVSLSRLVSWSQFKAAIDYAVANRYHAYNLNSYNCTHYAIKVFEATGRDLPETSGTWFGGGGLNPGDLGEDLRIIVLTSGETRDTNGGASPANQGTC